MIKAEMNRFQWLRPSVAFYKFDGLGEKTTSRTVNLDGEQIIFQIQGGGQVYEYGPVAFGVSYYVLAGLDGRNSHYRYATTLREAAKRQIAAGELVGWLGENGGVNALYRPTTMLRAAHQTKSLHLNQRITFPREGSFTLTLRHDGKGFFDVVEGGAA
jgi:hypothetical protein